MTNCFNCGKEIDFLEVFPRGNCVVCHEIQDAQEEEHRIRAYEEQGMTRSDAQGVVIAEDMQKIRNTFGVK